MRSLYTLLVVELVLLVCILFNAAYSEAVIAQNYEQAYESARAELEGFTRTKGAHINNAYTCKSKPTTAAVAMNLKGE